MDWQTATAGRMSVLQRNELLEMAEEVASIGHWLLELETGALHWSNEVFRIHGVQPDTYRPDLETAIDFYHPEDATRVASLMDRAISEKKPFEFEFRLVRGDGEVRLVHSRARVRTDGADKVVSVFGTFQDVTLRKRRETMRRDLLALSTVDGLSAEQKVERLLLLGRQYLRADAGYVEEDQPDGRRLLVDDGDNFLTAGQEVSWKPMSESAAAGEPGILGASQHLAYVNAWATSDHAECTVRTGSGVPLRVNGRRFGVLWFVRRNKSEPLPGTVDPDVVAELGLFVSNELAEIERCNEIQLGIQRIRQQQQELDLILDTVPARIWYKDAHNRILRLNRRAAESMGMSREEAEGADVADLFPEMAEKYHRDDLAVIHSGKPLLGIVEMYTPRDGPRGWVSTDKIPFEDAETSEPRLLVVATDITSVMRTQRELEAQSDALRKSNEALDQFAHVAAHDLRSPMRGIRHLTDWIKEDLTEALPAGVPTPVQEKLDLLDGRIARLDRMLGDMLSFARVSVSKNAPPEQVPDINGILSEAVSWADAPEGITIHAETVPFGLRIVPTLMRQMLNNLIRNAVRHHDKDKGLVQVRASRLSDGACIRIRDDGPGIDEAYHDKVFGLFSTLKRRDEADSSGVGLAIVQRIINELGGRVELTSPGQERGCEFSLFFPEDLILDETQPRNARA